MTLAFRGLAKVPEDGGEGATETLLEPLRPAFYSVLAPHHEAAWTAWLERYCARVRADGRGDAARRAAMDAVNPLYVLRNWLAQEAIERAEAGDFAAIEALLDVVRAPYCERPGLEHHAQKRPEWARHKAGCSMLSCSS